MKYFNALGLLSVLSGVVHASSSCGLEVVSLLAQGNAAAVASHFDGGARKSTREQLAVIAALAGSLSNIAAVARPSFAQSIRVSALAEDLPQKYAYEGFWINARSSKQGPIQWHIAVKPGTDCILLAALLDRPHLP